MPAPVSVWWQDKWGCLNVRKEGWAPGADRHVFEHNDVAVEIPGCFILRIYYYLLDVIIINFPRDLFLMAAALVVAPPNGAVLCKQCTLPGGNLLVTGVNMFCIFNPGKFLQMGSCHPGKWVCDLYPPLAQSEWWKWETLSCWKDPQLASALACEANHSSIPLLLLQHKSPKISSELVQK